MRESVAVVQILPFRTTTITMSNVQLYKSRLFVFTWHLIAAAQYYYAIHYHQFSLVIPDDLGLDMLRPGLGGRSRFLTYWCLVSVCLTPRRSILNIYNKCSSAANVASN